MRNHKEKLRVIELYLVIFRGEKKRLNCLKQKEKEGKLYIKLES